MTTSRDGFPEHTTITREVYADEPAAARPRPPRHRRLVHVGGSSCTLMQEFWTDEPVRDAHYPDVDLHREREAARLTQAAADSILRPDFRGEQ